MDYIKTPFATKRCSTSPRLFLFEVINISFVESVSWKEKSINKHTSYLQDYTFFEFFKHCNNINKSDALASLALLSENETNN